MPDNRGVPVGTLVRRILSAAALAVATVMWSIPQSQDLTEQQREFIEAGVDRFAKQGLDLPHIRFEFHPTTLMCHGHKGYYLSRQSTLHMCSMDSSTLLHELAHAWGSLSLSASEKVAFAHHRGLTAWNDLDQPWEDRATEHAAETLTWALADEPNQVRFVETRSNGSSVPVFRLLTIEDSSVQNLHDNFIMLTGREPIFRTPADWDPAVLEARWILTTSAAPSPEAARGA